MNKSNNIIIDNTNSERLYMTIPIEYYCVYNKLLKLLSNIGQNMLDDCKSSCSSDAKNVFTCWQMFQTACAANQLKEYKKADTIIKYINIQLQLGCPDIIRLDTKVIYYGDSVEEPTLDDILKGSNIDFNKYPIFNAPFFKLYNYIAVPQGVIISTIENVNFGEDFLYNESTDDDKYTRRKILINEEPYLLWLCDFIQPLNSDIKINTREGNWGVNNILYYGESNEYPFISDIIHGDKLDISLQNKLDISVYTKGHYIAIPEGCDIKTIENASFRGDWLYNLKENIDLYNRTNIIIDDHKYVLWYSEFAQPINGTIEIIIK